MVDLLAWVVVLIVCGAPIIVGGTWLHRVRASYRSSHAIQAWLTSHATQVACGHVPTSHPLFRRFAARLRLEPDAPGPVKHGVLWNAGIGMSAARTFGIVAHSPAVAMFPPTWRCLVEGVTDLPADSVLVIAPRTAELFTSGALKKGSLHMHRAEGVWDWADIRWCGDPALLDWLTPSRAATLRDLLSPGRALQVYPGFIVCVCPGDDVVSLLEEVLEAPDLVSPVQDSAPIARQAEPRGELDWTPMSPVSSWQHIDVDASRQLWSLRAEPDRVLLVVPAMFVLVWGVFVFDTLTHPPISWMQLVTMTALVGAVSGYAALEWRRAWRLGSIDLAQGRLKLGTGRTWEACQDVRIDDISEAVALQVIRDMKDHVGSGSSPGRRLEVSLQVNLVLADDTRVHLACFDGPEVIDPVDGRVTLPALLVELSDHTGWPILQHT